MRAGIQRSADQRHEVRVHGRALRLVEGVLRRQAEPLQVVRRERRDEKPDTAAIEDGVLEIDLRLQKLAGGARLGGVVWGEDDAHEAVRHGDTAGPPPLAIVNSELHAAVNARGDVVGVTLDVGRDLQQLLLPGHLEVEAREGEAREDPGNDGGRGGPQALREGDAVLRPIPEDGRLLADGLKRGLNAFAHQVALGPGQYGGALTLDVQ
mmetsp:Transcript_104690/g.293426  ORF Transcript_104690/g.293426 Transcript_104690/m.293426 type:complete len:209 (+) Transcript_104690:537-1163(+)